MSTNSADDTFFLVEDEVDGLCYVFESEEAAMLFPDEAAEAIAIISMKSSAYAAMVSEA